MDNDPLTPEQRADALQACCNILTRLYGVNVSLVAHAPCDACERTRLCTPMRVAGRMGLLCFACLQRRVALKDMGRPPKHS